MNKIIKQFGLLPGDRIIVPKSGLRIIQHHVLYLGQNHHGVDLIAENKVGFGVRLLTADVFFKGVIEITRIKKFPGNNFQRKIAVQRALHKMGKPYHLIDYNCQHFANEIQYGKIESDQVNDFFTGLKIAVGILLLFGLSSSLSDD